MKITVRPHTPPGGGEDLIGLHFPYDKDLIGWLKDIRMVYRGFHPGRQKCLNWDPESKCWVLRPEAWAFVRHNLENTGFKLATDGEAGREKLTQITAPYRKPPESSPEN